VNHNSIILLLKFSIAEGQQAGDTGDFER